MQSKYKSADIWSIYLICKDLKTEEQETNASFYKRSTDQGSQAQ